MLENREQEEFFAVSGWIQEYLVTGEKCGELEAWLAADERNRVLFGRICAEETMRGKGRAYREAAPAAAYEAFVRRRRGMAWRRGLVRWGSCAALVAMCWGGWQLWEMRTEGVRQPAGVEVAAGEGGAMRRPVLTLASGERLVLEEGETAFGAAGQGRVVPGAGGTGVQGGVEEADAREAYNVLEIPPMCDFHFVMEDGTKVWMNASSSLRYPERFAAGERTVYASGEVYFEVAKDAGRPFYVVLDGMRVRVLGTSFNVRDYAGEGETEVTLAEGKVAAEVGGEEHVLTPGNRLSVEEGTGRVEVQPVDVEEVLSWRRGFYVFRKCGLRKVAATLRHWYDVDIELAGERTAGMVYTGVVNKEEPLEVFLRRLEEVSEVRCRREGDTVVIQ